MIVCHNSVRTWFSLLASHYSFVYVHIAIQVYKIDLGNCTSYNSCESCTRSNNPLCGWCVLESHCSRMVFCQSASLQHRWVQHANKCISDLQLQRANQTEESFRDVRCAISKVMLCIPTVFRAFLSRYHSTVIHLGHLYKDLRHTVIT